MAERKRLFGAQYGSAPFAPGESTGPRMPPPDGKPPMRLPIATPGDQRGAGVSAAAQPAPGDALDGDPYTQLVQLLQMAGRL